MADEPAEHPERPDFPYPPDGSDVILDYENGRVVFASRAGGVSRTTAEPGGIAVTEAFLEAAGLGEL